MATAVTHVLEGGGTEFLGRTGDLLPQEKQSLGVIPVPVRFQPGAPDSALPPQVLFGALRHPALRLIRPIPLRTERSEHGISVIWEEGQEFGYGETFGAAIYDFSDTVAELYLHLNDAEALSEDLIALRTALSRYIDIRRHQ